MDQSQNQPHPSEADIYKRIKVLGCGSYGRAFLVQQKETNQQWVIKQINLADLSPEEQEIALKQSKILQMLDHQNIVKFKEVYRTAKMKLNIVMEYASGGDLSHKIKEAKDKNKYFSEQQILQWFLHLCMAVRYIHSKKIIHRDLKAQNVFLTHDGLVKLGDFGVAKILQHTASKARTVVGSPYYLSPEIIENKPYSFKTDIWSLGTLLFEMCALHPPFTANNLQFLALKIVQGGIPHLPNKYSQGLRALVKSMLQTKEANRPTIRQILKFKIMEDTIQRVVNKSKIYPQTVQNFAYLSDLKPPPNLLCQNISQNRSEIILSKQQKEAESPSNMKPKTPFVNAKRGPNNFFSRPISGRRKMQVPNNNDLADLIQIKPSLLQKHQKYQRPQIPLPNVGKVFSNQKFVQSPVVEKNDIRKTDNPKQKLEVISPPSTAFSKKRPSLGNISAQKKQGIKAIQQIKFTKPEIKKVNLNQPKKEKQSKKFNSKVQIKKKPLPTKKQATELKLEINSQEVKRKIENQKKMEKKNSQKIKKPEKPRKSKKNIIQKQQKVSPVMQEQKYNCENQNVSMNDDDSNYYTNYQNDEFESYQSEDQNSQVNLSFSETGKSKLGTNFQKLLQQLLGINKNSENGQDIDEMISEGGSESIPQLIKFSNQIRQDDTEFESNSSNVQKELITEHLKIDIESIKNQQELQNVRIQLEQALGLENTLFTYHKIQEKIDREGLAFGEEEIISQIVAERPEIDKETLKKHLGLIVAILLREKDMF